MPLQNRVSPYGEIVAVPERGTMLGNRGILHDEHQHLVRTSQVRRWLTCVLEFKGIRRTVMSPHRYTELFFLDEATALSAGHRPCCECRREDYRRFQVCWQQAFGVRPGADEMDSRLQQDRRLRGRKVTYQDRLADLPDGTFFERAGQPGQAWLRHDGGALLWSPGGYLRREPPGDGTVTVTVLTPRATVALLRAGYQPLLHHSANPVDQPA
jgi:hypothetical protein